jgi:hypothetical protein
VIATPLGGQTKHAIPQDGVLMDQATLTRVAASEKESGDLDFKAGFDSAAQHDWCEFVKDVVAMANSGCGLLVFGVNDDGSPAPTDLTDISSLDPAVIVDKIAKYTDQHFAGFSLATGTRCGAAVVIVEVCAVSVPIVFTAPGTYDIGGGKQKTAFARGTVYFRHGAKSEPGTSDDFRAALDRELDRIRSSWLDGIAKLVTAPVGATISVLPGEVHLSGAEGGTGVRLVNDESAPAFKAFRTDLLYPYRQKELVARVNTLLDGPTIIAHDIYCVRKVYAVDAEPNFFYKPQFSSPQYSQAFAEWLVERYRADANFFHAAREAAKKHDGS